METDKEKNQALRILCIVFTFLAINFFLCRGSIAQTETSPTREADIYRDIQVQFEQERYKYQRYRDIVLEHKRLEQIKEDLAAYPPKITEKKKKSGLLNNI